MKYIQLTQGKQAIVDDRDYGFLNQFKWRFLKEAKEGSGYAVRWFNNLDGAGKEGRTLILMHRLLTDPPEGFYIDHINNDGLDNRRANMRFVTPDENTFNRKIRIDNTSGYKGVQWHKHTAKWVARISVFNKRISLGYFDDPKEAAKAYNEAAKRFYGEFATLNPL